MTSRSPIATRFVALTLALTLTPGWAEAVENVWHLAQEGHSAHAVDAGSDHEPTDDEHGCSGTFHVCSCHHASSILPLFPARQALTLAECRATADLTLPPAPFLSGLLRPPQG